MLMKRSLRIFICLIFLVSVFGIIQARDLNTDYSFLGDKNRALIEFYPGWNLLTSQVSENVKDYFPEVENEDICKFSEFKATYVYDSINKKYISEKDLSEEYFDSGTEDRFRSNLGSAWFYSEKNCFLMLGSDIQDDKSFLNLIQGWNFLSITPSMNEKSFNDIKGDCNLISFYVWDPEGGQWEDGEWKNMPFNIKIGQIASIGSGFIIKVENNCKLNFGSSSGAGEIPDLPQ